MKPEKIFTTSVITLIVIVLLVIVICFRSYAQSIGVGLQVSNDTTTQYKFLASEVINCWGFYGSVLTKEDPMSDYTRDNCDVEENGISLGINYTFMNGHFRELSFGYGYYNIHVIDKFDNTDVIRDDKKIWFIEANAAIMVTRWLDITFGFNTMPMVMSGLQLRLNFN